MCVCVCVCEQIHYRGTNTFTTFTFYLLRKNHSALRFNSICDSLFLYHFLSKTPQSIIIKHQISHFLNDRRRQTSPKIFPHWETGWFFFYAILCPGQFQLIVTVCRKIRSAVRCVHLYNRFIIYIIYQDKHLHSVFKTVSVNPAGLYDQLVDLQRFLGFLSLCVSVSFWDEASHIKNGGCTKNL